MALDCDWVLLGDLPYLAVSAEIIWGGPVVQAFEGVQCLLRFRVKLARWLEASLPLRWCAAELSPVV